ncbi:PREDICTED: serine protease snake-like [Nicrophorus vespilloides]|uniref:Serine protease snake-like n=1 Tax=Nicrophorus vespilloides TaxID=110193 RepID=A0ABM1MCT7_NICVS|nr:PREDICTED: serine protease snake-like [Nicrophorus vespilloides]
MFIRALVSLVMVSLVTGQLTAGDTCFHERLQKSGVCMLPEQCLDALEDLMQAKRPQLCSYGINSPIVCCPIPKKDAIGDKSANKCADYAKLVYITYETPLLSISNRNLTRDECGIKSNPLMVRGNDAFVKELPHMVAIGYEDAVGRKVFECSGSLISDQFVLTAAHCLHTRQFGDAKYARFGDLDLKDTNDGAYPQEYRVEERIAHPDYKSPSRYHDLALLKLERAVLFNAYVRPICLNSRRVIESEKAIFSGWGIGYGNEKNRLRRFTTSLMSTEDCQKRYPDTRKLYRSGITDDWQFCATSRSDQTGLCNAHAGGPLQVHNEEQYCMYSLIGVTSLGNICGSANLPGVYTRVSHYLDWIEKTVWP